MLLRDKAGLCYANLEGVGKLETRESVFTICPLGVRFQSVSF